MSLYASPITPPYDFTSQLTIALSPHPIISLCTLSLSIPLLVSVSNQGHIQVHHLTSDSLSPLTSFHFSHPRLLLETAAVRTLSPTSAIIALAGTVPTIFIFSLTVQDSSFHITQLPSVSAHRDCICNLAFSPTDPILLASASMDGTARLWSLDPAPDVIDEFDLHTARMQFSIQKQPYSLSALALLDEHTGAVQAVTFAIDQPKLLTASMDGSVIVWKKQTQGTWQSVARFGSVDSMMGICRTGLFAVAFVGNDVMAGNCRGVVQWWTEEEGEMIEKAGIGGHFGEVLGMDWNSTGQHLLTAGKDMTVRLFKEVESEGKISFVEWARPQTHGHSVFAVSFCSEDGTKYVSGSEERMLRVFAAPKGFKTGRRGGAVRPELGLSNKAVVQQEDDEVEEGWQIPLEDDLRNETMWPETGKLYGHGNEIASIAVDLIHGIIASSCKAQKMKDAGIILWDVESGVECGRLETHELTVNNLRFDKTGNSLLSVSRDRSLAIFKRNDPEKRFGFELMVHVTKAHSRLIYCGSWLMGGKLVATGGRDKWMKIHAAETCAEWKIGSEIAKIKFGAGVSAVDAYDFEELEHMSVLAVGLENGEVRIFKVSMNSTSKNVQLIEERDSVKGMWRCGGQVNQMRWRPRHCELKENVCKMQLGLVSADHSVRVLEFSVPFGTP